MSDKLRTALKGGGRISILIDMQADGSFHIQVTEDWARLSRVEQAVLPAERLTAAEDPDAPDSARPHRAVVQNEIVHGLSMRPLHNR